MSPPTECVPVYHPLQTMSMGITPNRIYPSITLTEHGVSYTTKHDSVTPSVSLSVASDQICPYSCLSYLKRTWLCLLSVSPDRLNLSCLLDQLTTEYVSVSWVPPIEKKKYRLLGVIPCENLPHLLCACHLLAHGPGLGLHAVQFLFLFTDIGFYLPIISSS